MTTQGLTTTLEQGFERRTLTCFFSDGQGWKTKCFTTWKGEDSGELSFSDSTWFSTLEECEEDLKKREQGFKDLGWK